MEEEAIWNKIVAMRAEGHLKGIGEELYRHYQEPLKRSLKQQLSLRDESLLDDIVVTSLAKLYRAIVSETHHHETALFPYLIGMGKNIHANIVRSDVRRKNRHERHQQQRIQWEESTPDRILMDKEFSALIPEVMAQIGERCKQIIRWYRNRAKAQDIAENLGYASAEVVRYTVHRCKEKIKKILRDKGII